MKRTTSLAYTLFAIALTWYLASSLQQCASGNEAAQTGAGYLGDKACQRCHQEAYADWLGSHHDLAMQEANDSTVLGDFNDVTFESKGLTSRLFRKDGKFFINTEGPDGQMHDYEIAYTFGVYPLQQYMVRFPQGRVQCLHIAWDSRENKWFDLQPERRFSPDDWMHWTRGSMTWNTMCADCHSTNLQKNYDPETDAFNTTYSIIDVSCEACHGPGREHLRYVTSANYQQGKRVPGSMMHLTADLSSVEQVDECARCHSLRSQRSFAYDHSGEFLDHYVPELLRPGLYHPDGQILEEVYVYGSFLQSKMYRSHVRCTDCHNPHSLELVAVGNALCGQCHVPEQYDTPAHHFHPVATEGAECINCHMPGKYYMVNDFRRDHSFRVPRPDLSVQYGTPNACTQCHTDRSDEWAAEAIEQWYGPERTPHYAEVLAPALGGDLSVGPQLVEMVSDTGVGPIVRATAVWLLSSAGSESSRSTILGALKNPDPLIRYTAVSAMEPFPAEDKLRHLLPMLEDSVRSVRDQTAYVLADVPQRLIPEKYHSSLEAVTEEYLATLRMQADFPAGRMMRGQYYHKKGNLGIAEEAYRHAVDLDPYLPQPHTNLANLYYEQGDLQTAAAEFQKAIELDSTNGQAWYSYGLLLAELNQMQEAASALGRAAPLTGNPRHYYNWGLTLQHLNRPEAAEQVYRQALSIDPDSEPNLYALAILYLQQQRPAQARPLIMQLIQLDPQNERYRELLRVIGLDFQMSQ